MTDDVEKLSQIMLRKKKAPLMEIREPKDETIFHFKNISG